MDIDESTTDALEQEILDGPADEVLQTEGSTHNQDSSKVEAEDQQTGGEDAATESTDDNLTSDTTEQSESNDADKTDVTPPKFDQDLDSWAEKTGRAKPTTDTERALLQEIRNSQRAFSKEQEAKKEAANLQQKIDQLLPLQESQEEYTDEYDQRLAQVERNTKLVNDARLRSEYMIANEVDQETGAEMAAVLQEAIDSDNWARFNFYSDSANLADLHSLAKSRLLGSKTVDNSEIEERARQKERERLAQLQQANGPSNNATSNPVQSQPESQEDEDMEIVLAGLN